MGNYVPSAERTPGREPSLDGLRGVAAFVVVLYHITLVVPAVSSIYVGGVSPSPHSIQWWLYRTPLRLFVAGHEAVLIFFVLSGFVLTLPLTRVGGPRWSWRAYYPRRLCRLYLPVWAALALALLLALVVTRDVHFGSSWLASHKPPTAHAVGKDGVLLFGTSNLDSPLWSLRWEVWFSLLLPVMFGLLLLLRVRRWWPAAVLLLVGMSLASRFAAVVDALPVSWMTVGLLQYLPVFGIGMLLALNRDQVERIGARISGAAWWAVTVVALLMVVSPSLVGAPGAPFGAVKAATYAASLLGAATLVFIALEWAGAGRTLESRPVQWAGSRSFTIYLIHEPIVVATALSVKAHSFLPWMLIAVPLVPVILLVAEVFYRFVEKRTHRLSRRVGELATPRNAPDPHVTAVGEAEGRGRHRSSGVPR